MDNFTLHKLFPGTRVYEDEIDFMNSHPNSISLKRFFKEIKQSRFLLVGKKLSLHNRHLLVKLQWEDGDGDKTLLEARLEMGSEFYCKMFNFKEILQSEYENGFNVSLRRQKQVLDLNFPSLADRELEINLSAHFTPGHTNEIFLSPNQIIFVDLDHLTIIHDYDNELEVFIEEHSKDFRLVAQYEIQFGVAYVLKFKHHNIRDQYLVNFEPYINLRERLQFDDYMGKLYIV